MKPKSTAASSRAIPVTYTRGEGVTLWLCWLTPGMALGLLSAAYLKWFWRIFSPTPVWHGWVLWGAFALVLAGCAGFASYLREAKFGRPLVIGRLLKSAFFFALWQALVAPLIGWMLLWWVLKGQ
ncbi:hypothetical protein [Luteolibacter marinus]|uniref:hypothetical protein n=1 Tax=Luteolibacter marinus TaxID=2776705 RepID=UPI0018675CAB|nr:hypothetical protein [Luteolibacter marinus]